MNSPILKRATRILFCFALAGISLCSLVAKPDDKLTPAEVVIRHLESIGSAESKALA